MTRKGETKRLRSFGLLVGGVSAGVGLWPWLMRQEDPRQWALAVGAGLILPALIVPGVLAPAYRVWMMLADGLGWINTRILLGLVFYGLVTPMGVVMRRWSRDPMRRRFEPETGSYRVLRKPRPGSHMLRQF